MSLGFEQLGFRYHHDQEHYSQADIDRWLPVFQSVQTHWLILSGTETQTIPEFFLRSLIDTGIKPIVQLDGSFEGTSVRTLSPLFTKYADYGVEHIVLHDRPNMRSQWNPSIWSQGDLVERFLDHLIPLLELQNEYGLKPIFPALEPGGDYWDTAFLRTALGSLQRRGKGDLLEDLTVGLYQWNFDKPLDWGAGGPTTWTTAKPYSTPADSQDQRGFRIYEWYAAICREVVGTVLPMMALGSGISPQTRDDVAGPDLDTFQAMIDFIRNDRLPDLVRTLALDPHTVAENLRENWEPFVETQKPSERIKDKVKRLFATEEQCTPNPIPSNKKVIAHYVLLPMTDQRNIAQDWVDVGPFALAVKPVVGFSVEEARLAERVTIIGSETDISAAIENQLRNAGCEVNRFQMADASELLVMAAELASKNLTSGVVHV